ncbi:hypothetical protein [Actinoplanes sp. NBRC 101535]|uniref:hypothetical protein n=1 Tax=Actinoplanes sp. NBRC 101535 TaxID=3032196 RepID=UPI0024A10944|nr:hypothetical protein [Actinoplanes sp. NBRC 101535]GLY04370.1 hypothetical protein Acsp01_47490 [Actinoplanes sp. NBRC 101535]
MDMYAAIIAARMARQEMESALPHAEVVPPRQRWTRLRRLLRGGAASPPNSPQNEPEDQPDNKLESEPDDQPEDRPDDQPPEQKNPERQAAATR